MFNPFITTVTLSGTCFDVQSLFTFITECSLRVLLGPCDYQNKQRLCPNTALTDLYFVMETLCFSFKYKMDLCILFRRILDFNLLVL
jgi:hypothetical protein